MARCAPGGFRRAFLPLQSGVGNIANAVLARAGQRIPEIPPFEMYTEVLQDSVVPLLESGRVQVRVAPAR